MTKLADDRSIIAVDPSSRGLAFVFFENGKLLDWGTRRNDGGECALLQRVLHRYKADVLVLEDPHVLRAERRPRVRHLLGLLAEAARNQGVPVVAVSRFAVRREWAERGLTRKHAVAATIGAMFPEIEPLVPRTRKVFRSEEARTEIFDAASLVLHAFGVVHSP